MSWIGLYRSSLQQTIWDDLEKQRLKKWDESLRESGKQLKDDRALATLADRNAYCISYMQRKSDLIFKLPECKL